MESISSPANSLTRIKILVHFYRIVEFLILWSIKFQHDISPFFYVQRRKHVVSFSPFFNAISRRQQSWLDAPLSVESDLFANKGLAINGPWYPTALPTPIFVLCMRLPCDLDWRIAYFDL